jgi:glutamine amidotransferase
MNRVAIVDTGMCNLDSVRRAVEECGATGIVTGQPGDLRSCDRILLPGVGAFADAMASLRAHRLDVALADEAIDGNAPMLGICLGMQLLATTGWEGGRETPGLGFIEGEVVPLQPTEARERIPHIGWNSVEPEADAVLFEGIEQDSDFYFVHSFRVACKPEDLAATTPYCGGFASAIQRGSLFGLQFHPEKSQHNGFRVLANFLKI